MSPPDRLHEDVAAPTGRRTKGVNGILFFLTGEQVGLKAFHHAVKFARVAVARLDIRKLADKGAVAFVQVLTGGYQS